jgi:hypothetical protein
MTLRLVPLLVLATALATAGCGYPTLHITQAEVASDGRARVILKEIDGRTFKLEVVNESSDPLVVYRDRVTAQLPSGTEERLPGGATNLYTVSPGSSHAVNVSFNLDGLKAGDDVWILLNDAVTLKGTTVVLKPIKTVVE